MKSLTIDDDGVKHVAGIGARSISRLLGAEDLRNFGQYLHARHAPRPIGDPADQRIGGEPGHAVRPAAFEADHRVRPRRRSSRASRSAIATSSASGRQPGVEFVAFGLRGEHAHTGQVGGAGVAPATLELIRFAAQPDDQHAAGIGMGGQRRQDAAGAGEVIAQLRTAERMGERMHAVDAAGESLRAGCGDPLGGRATQPTVHRIQISLRVPTRPSARR